jgi:hypothetical protein
MFLQILRLKYLFWFKYIHTCFEIQVAQWNGAVIIVRGKARRTSEEKEPAKSKGYELCRCMNHGSTLRTELK